MTVSERRRLKKAGWAVVTTFAVMAAVILPSNPVSADVDSISGSAYGASLNSSLLGLVLPPTPAVSGSATEPIDTYGPFASSAVPLAVPGLLATGVLNASTQGGNLAADEAGGGHAGFATSRASVADVLVGAGAIFADVVEVTCTSNGDGSTGTTEIVGGVLGGTTPLVVSPINEPISVSIPGVLTATINEKVVTEGPGFTSIAVNGIHAQLLPAVPGLPVIDLIIGHVECAAIGPDVLAPSTTTTIPDGSTTSTIPDGSTTTTSTIPDGSTTSTTPTGSTTSTPPGVSTTQPPTVTTTSTTTPTITGSTAAPGTTTTRVVAGGLARTGTSGMRAMVILAFVFVVLGGLIRMGGRGLAPDALASVPVNSLPPWARPEQPSGPRPLRYDTAAPDRWGPAEISKAVGFGFVALAVGCLKALVPEGKRRRRR